IEGVLAHEALLFPPGDAGALAARLERLLDDDGERGRLAGLARARAAEYAFDWDARAVEVLEGALAGAHG
ncbi:MAG TPA: hypothetical protein VFO85_11760, partial [Vicinamibacteria bacterium]|nr:hypothetical protein [Vicinamibacteria bacterium]